MAYIEIHLFMDLLNYLVFWYVSTFLSVCLSVSMSSCVFLCLSLFYIMSIPVCLSLFLQCQTADSTHFLSAFCNS